VTRSALLIIDIQEGMFSIPGFDVHEPHAFLSRVAALIARARTVGVPVIYVQHLGVAGSPLETGTGGVEIHATIAPQADELVIPKEESDAFLRTELRAELDRLGVTALYVCGMQTEYCVDTTCRRAHGLGYDVILIEDGHTTGGAGSLTGEQIVAHHNETLGGSFVTLRRAAEVFA
jgi:nicotinamidase-related amidase